MGEDPGQEKRKAVAHPTSRAPSRASAPRLFSFISMRRVSGKEEEKVTCMSIEIWKRRRYGAWEVGMFVAEVKATVIIVQRDVTTYLHNTNILRSRNKL